MHALKAYISKISTASLIFNATLATISYWLGQYENQKFIDQYKESSIDTFIRNTQIMERYKAISDELSKLKTSINGGPIYSMDYGFINVIEEQKIKIEKNDIVFNSYFLMFLSGSVVNSYVNIFFKIMPWAPTAIDVSVGITLGNEVIKFIDSFYESNVIKEFNVVKILTNFSYHAGAFYVQDYLTNYGANVAISSIGVFFGALTLRVIKESIEEFYNSGNFVISNISSKYSSAINKVFYFLDVNVFKPQFKTIGINMSYMENAGYIITSGFYEVLDKPLANVLKEAINILEVKIYNFYEAFTSTPDNNNINIIEEL